MANWKSCKDFYPACPELLGEEHRGRGLLPLSTEN